MNWTIALPLFIGCFGILQGAMNRVIASHIGVAQASLITNIGSTLFCAILYYFAKAYSHLMPEFYQIKAPLSTYKWWFIFPPLFGFAIVAGIPYSIAKLGAVKVTVGLIAAQMITSVVWDLLVEGVTINMMKFVGIVFAFLSVTFITLSKS